jgi:hypothetical protein
MQLIDTKVSHDSGNLKVEFIGEGGEVVLVQTSDNPFLGEEAAIDHAKAMMVQLTAFEMADDRPSRDTGASSKDGLDGDDPLAETDSLLPEKTTH